MNMLSEKETTHLSKLLSLILRHNPAQLGLTLDSQGWAEVDELLAQAQARKVPLTLEKLVYLVETSPKQRFRFSDDQRRIRASQGHSVAVELGYEPLAPPEILYHGTAVQKQVLIAEQGLKRMSRQHVHLSTDLATALAVGRWHGRPVVFLVEAGRMQQEGFLFYRADNGVWLTNEVLPGYLRLLEDAEESK